VQLSSNGDLQIALAGQGKLIMRFADSSGTVRLHPEQRLELKTNYMVGRDTSRWRFGVPNYARLRVHGLYDGIEALFYGRAGELE
jgi:hypothetical protein